MQKLLFIITVILISPNLVNGQEKLATIIGQVIDSATKEPLDKASISLLKLSEDKAFRYTLPNKNGFRFRQIHKGKYTLIASHSGYCADTITVIIDTDSTLNIGNIILTPAADMLMEVVVRATIPPVLVRNDTLVFNPNAVRTQPNATVEDLLKKLPGIQVDKDGGVSINGRKVEKIYIDGKEFILGDPRTATQNLTADMIEVVEAFDHQSKRARFTGIRENTNTKAINLKIKKNKRNTLLFNTTAGVGTGKTITGRINATTFRSDYWLVGNADFNAVDTRTKNNGIFERSANQDVNWKSSIAPNIDVTLNARLGQSRSSSSQMQTRETFLGDSSLLQETTSGNASTGTTATATAQATWAIDTFNTIVYGLTVNNSRTTSRNGQAT